MPFPLDLVESLLDSLLLDSIRVAFLELDALVLDSLELVSLELDFELLLDTSAAA